MLGFICIALLSTCLVLCYVVVYINSQRRKMLEQVMEVIAKGSAYAREAFNQRLAADARGECLRKIQAKLEDLHSEDAAVRQEAIVAINHECVYGLVK